MNLFLNLGRSISGVLTDAVRQFGQPKQLFVLALEGDRLLGEIELPTGTEVLTVDKYGTLDKEVEVYEKDICVLNGGTTAQQWAMASISLLGRRCTAVNLQPTSAWFLSASDRVAAGEKAIHGLTLSARELRHHGDAADFLWMELRSVANLLGKTPEELVAETK